jgi:uncharacterized integral membrane protein
MMEEITVGAIIMGALAAVFMLAFLMYNEVTSDKIVLIKNEWTCTKSVVSVLPMAGGGLIPIDNCTRWEAK